MLEEIQKICKKHHKENLGKSEAVLVFTKDKDNVTALVKGSHFDLAVCLKSIIEDDPELKALLEYVLKTRGKSPVDQ